MRAPTWRGIAAAGLVAGPVSLMTADVLRRSVEPGGFDPVRITAAAAESAETWLAAGLLSAATAFLLLPGLIALASRVDGRGAGMVRSGCALLGVGCLASLVHAAGYFGLYGVLAQSGSAATSVENIDAASESYPFFVVFIVLYMAGMLLGPLVLSFGLRRARLVPVWTPVAAVVFVAASLTSSVPAGLVGLAAALAFFVPAARWLLDPGAVTAGRGGDRSRRVEVAPARQREGRKQVPVRGSGPSSAPAAQHSAQADSEDRSSASTMR